MTAPVEDADRQPSSRGGGRIAWSFIAWSFGVGWPAAGAVWILRPPDAADDAGPTILALLLFAIPLLSALVLARSRGVSKRRSWGLRIPSATALLFAPLIALALTAFATAMPVLSGVSRLDLTAAGEVQRLAEEHRTESLELLLEIEEHGAVLRGRIVTGLIAGVILGLLIAPIVELPWRGLLFSELEGRSFARPALLSAAMATLWWLPLQLWGDLAGPAGGSLSAIMLLSYALLCVPLAWARAQTGSIIPGGVLLATCAALSHVPALALSGGTRLQIDLFMLATVALLAGVALIWPPEAQSEQSVLEEPADETERAQ